MSELVLQKYLRSGGTPEWLAESLAIGVYRHPSLPLVGFKYDQSASPRFDPVVRDCRGTVLEDGSWDLVAKPFRRFYNAGEQPDAPFDWSDFTCTAKEDGSLIVVYHYAGEWHANTSGSFGLGLCQSSGSTWRDVFWRAANIRKNRLCPAFTYIFELCTRHNRVVRHYPEPTAFLLAMFSSTNGLEVPPANVRMYAQDIGAATPETFSFGSQAEIADFLEAKAETDRTFEGMVVRDRHGERLKIKSKSYVELHRTLDNGNLMRWDRLVPLILSGEAGEVMAYFPDARPMIEEATAVLDGAFREAERAWRETRDIASQKDFALAIRGRTPLTGLLFAHRKEHGDSQTPETLRARWLKSGDLIVKHLFDGKPIDAITGASA